MHPFKPISSQWRAAYDLLEIEDKNLLLIREANSGIISLIKIMKICSKILQIIKPKIIADT